MKKQTQDKKWLLGGCVDTGCKQLKQGMLIIFLEGDDYVVDEVNEGNVVCSKINMFKGCRLEEARDYIFLIDDINEGVANKECALI